MTLQVEQISWSVETRKIIDDIYLHVEEGEFIGLIGPNGSGKSTLLRTIYRALKTRQWHNNTRRFRCLGTKRA